MILLKIVLTSLLVTVASAAPTESRSLDYILANLTSLWEEVNQLKREVNFHLHDGDMHHEHDLDKTLDEVSVLAHEHHVHHLKHPHEGHNEHHNEYLLRHLEMAHGHGGHDGHDSHDDHGSSRGGHRGRCGMNQGHDSSSSGGSRSYDSGEDDDSHEEDSSGRRSHGGTDGLVDNCGDRSHRIGAGGIQTNGADRSRSGSYNPGPSPPHRRGGHGGHSGHDGHRGHREPTGLDAHDMHGDSHEDDHSFHGLNFNALGHVSSDAHFYERDHYTPGTTGLRPGERRSPLPPKTSVDDWEHAYCNILPNTDMPESQVRGKIDISQRIGGRHGVYFDIDVSGLDLTKSGRIYSAHVHESPTDGQRCDTAGGYNRPSKAALADPMTFGEEHAGNIGTFTAEDDGDIDHKISASIDVTFEEMIGKAIVIHSQNKERLACCNIMRVAKHGMH